MAHHLSESESTHEKSDGEGWLVHEEQQLLCQFELEAASQHSQWVTIRTFHWRQPDYPIPQARRRMLRQNALEAWQTMRHTGWRRCPPPVR